MYKFCQKKNKPSGFTVSFFFQKCNLHSVLILRSCCNASRDTSVYYESGRNLAFLILRSQPVLLATGFGLN